MHPAGGGGPHRLRGRAGASPSRWRSTALLRAELLLAARGRAWRRRARCASRCGPSPRSRCPTAPGWRCSRPARRRCEGVEPLVASANLARRAALAEDLDGPRRPAATSTSPSSRPPRSTPSPAAPPSDGARVVVRAQPAGRRGRCAAGARRCLMRETIVVHKGHGLPYSKGLMAQALSATGLSPERSFELARLIERAAGGARRRPRSTWRRCTRWSRRCCWPRRATAAVGRYRALAAPRPAGPAARGADRRHHRGRQVDARDDARRPAGREPRDRDGRDPPGAAGLLHPRGDADRARLGLRGRAGSRATATRPSRSAPASPRSSSGPPRRASRSWSRACTWCPGAFTRACASAACWSRRSWSWRTRSCTAATSRCGPGSRPAERYLAHFEEIRRLQDHLWERARSEGVAIIDNANVDQALARLMELVLDAVREDSLTARRPRPLARVLAL